MSEVKCFTNVTVSAEVYKCSTQIISRGPDIYILLLSLSAA